MEKNTTNWRLNSESPTAGVGQGAKHPLWSRWWNLKFTSYIAKWGPNSGIFFSQAFIHKDEILKVPLCKWHSCFSYVVAIDGCLLWAMCLVLHKDNLWYRYYTPAMFIGVCRLVDIPTIQHITRHKQARILRAAMPMVVLCISKALQCGPHVRATDIRSTLM